MIETITIQNVATFDSIGIQINNLKKINFLYGSNGSGKTTISNFLQNCSGEKFANCSVKWKNEQVLNLTVYNKEFRDQNFGKGKITGIFTLGQATTDEVKTIENKIENLKILKENGAKKRETLKSQIQKEKDLENNFKEYCWNKIFKNYELVFKEAFTGSLSKEKYKNRLLQEFERNTSVLKTFDELKEKAQTIFGEVPQNIQPINKIAYGRLIEIENDATWKKIIVGKADIDIAKLIQKLKINDWVNQGKSYLFHDDKICPFCQQNTISEGFKNQLEIFFDETYLNDIKLLKKLKEEFKSTVQNIINELNILEINQKNLKNSKLNIDKLSTYLKTLIIQTNTNNEFLNNKIKEPSRSIELVSSKEQLDLINEF